MLRTRQVPPFVQTRTAPSPMEIEGTANPSNNDSEIVPGVHLESAREGPSRPRVRVAPLGVQIATPSELRLAPSPSKVTTLQSLLQSVQTHAAQGKFADLEAALSS